MFKDRVQQLIKNMEKTNSNFLLWLEKQYMTEKEKMLAGEIYNANYEKELKLKINVLNIIILSRLI